MTKNLITKTVAEERKFRGSNARHSFSMKNIDKSNTYRWVITTYPEALDQYERPEYFMDKGWSVVYSEDRPDDNRAAAPDNTTENSDRLKPVTKRLRGGHSAILMKITKEEHQKNIETNVNNRIAKENLSRKSIKKRPGIGNELIVTEPDIDLNNK